MEPGDDDVGDELSLPAASTPPPPVSPRPAQRPTEAASRTHGPWLNRRVVPTWAVVVVALIGLAAGAAVGQILDPGDADESVATGENTSTSSTAVSTTTASTTEPPATTTTTAASTPTVEVTPDIARAAVSEVFEVNRVQLAEILAADPNVESVDLFELDPTQNLIRLDITSPFASPGEQASGAWELTRKLAEPLFSPEDGFFSTELYTPGFQLINSGTTYTCSAEVMSRLATFAASRADFEAEC